ncbi:hypothetical protein T210_0113620 [Burkholderia pseudomallei MSHR6137]|nr:hypothetical protein T210_0113620 [Burkholderia pseudomallei MSHR6137]
MARTVRASRLPSPLAHRAPHGARRGTRDHGRATSRRSPVSRPRIRARPVTARATRAARRRARPSRRTRDPRRAAQAARPSRPARAARARRRVSPPSPPRRCSC